MKIRWRLERETLFPIYAINLSICYLTVEIPLIPKFSINAFSALVEEYLHNGQVYMVRVVPNNAPPYYLLDTDGDGELDTRQEESDPGIKPVYWKLIEWD